MIYEQLFPIDFTDTRSLLVNSKKNFEELERIDKEQPKDSILYRYFTEPYADGKIYYQVTKVNKKTCTVKVCSGICLDEWDNGEYSVKIEYVKAQIDKRIALNDIFKKIN